MPKCPRCKKDYTGFPALCRRDNKTKICNECGEEEAWFDYGIYLQEKEEKKWLTKED